MHLSISAFAVLSLSSLITAQTCDTSNNTLYLTAPALVTTPQNTSTIQCWRLRNPFLISTTAGIAGSRALNLGNVTGLSYVVQPPRFEGGLHNAPVPQIVQLLAGLAHITLPQDPSRELWLYGGKGGLLFAADLTGEGHVTTYPSDQETVTITAPFEGGVIPEYEVINEGPCTGRQTFV